MKITLVPYSSKWQQLYNEEEARLKKILASLSPSIEHIGSTSIKGICAKPIIDIMVGVPSFDDLVKAAQLLQIPAYVYIRKYEDVMPFRRFFIKIKLQDGARVPPVVHQHEEIPAEIMKNRTHHIHMVEINSPFWKEHLLFRDYLRTNHDARTAYSTLKEKLAEREWKDENEYAAAKTKFIQSVLRKAKPGNK